MTDQTFDVGAWKAQGEKALNEIEAEISELEEKVESLREKKVEILKALGRYEQPEVEPGRKSKVMIRPILLQHLMETPGTAFSLEKLIDVVQEEKPTATASSIETSITRLVRKNEGVVQTDDGFSWVKPTNGAPAQA